MGRDFLSNFGATPTRLTVVVGLAILGAGFLAPAPFRSNAVETPLGQAVLGAALSMVVFGLVMDVWIYLRNTRSKELLLATSDGGDLEEMRAELKEIRSLAEGFATERAKVVLSNEDIEEVKQKTIDGLGADAVERISAAIRAEIDSKADAPDPTVSVVQHALMSSQRRLAQEIDSLGRRANVNLTIGFAVSLVGMIALAFFIYTANNEMDRNLDLMQVAIRFLVKLSLVVFMQVFAYFFLRLYRHSLFEIKYFQNELTNIEQKYLALNVALENKNANAVKTISEELAKAERNFILKKGETTVGLQREEIEARYEAMVATKAENLLDKLGSLARGKGQ
ncbi:hypothetical protein [Sinorhizobium fredii]|uniref:hypothetical protein n=1 Tax=Rhizobium fredii TaxID=380 RepID=UPI00351291DE